MLGKIIPYVGLAYVQTLLILVVSVTVFAVPVRGSVPLLRICHASSHLGAGGGTGAAFLGSPQADGG